MLVRVLRIHSIWIDIRHASFAFLVDIRSPNTIENHFANLYNKYFKQKRVGDVNMLRTWRCIIF